MAISLYHIYLRPVSRLESGGIPPLPPTVASIADGAAGRQDGYLISSVPENSNSFSAHGYTLDTITPRISYPQ